MNTYRMIRAGLNYWTSIGEFNSELEAREALIAYNSAIESRKARRNTRAPIRAIRKHATMIMATNWIADAFPNAVECRIARMKAE